MKSGDRFQYIVVASNIATGDRISAGAVSKATLQGLINELRAAGLTISQVTETMRSNVAANLTELPTG